MRRAVTIAGMLGMGDCIMQRAPVRALMQDFDVTLRTYYRAMYQDLEAEGLKLVIENPAAARIRENVRKATPRGRPAGGSTRTITYNREAIHKHGSILAAMYASARLVMPEKPDFAMPVLEEWRDAARAKIGDTGGKPIMIYRPIVLNNFWKAESRSPSPAAYAALYSEIREAFFVVGVANIGDHGEYLVGPPQPVDRDLTHGELSFEELAGAFAIADLVFGNAGFTPVIAQAVGTPNICVYGGNESFRTTNSVGAHLAPTLAIEPINPCECHNQKHDCDKTIDMTAALPRVAAFAAMVADLRMREGELVEALAQNYGDYVKAPLPGLEALGQAMYAPGAELSAKTDDKVSEKYSEPRVLIFGTSYVDTADAMNRLKDWVSVHKRLNPDCDLLIIDSASPLLQSRHGQLTSWRGVDVLQFTDNIGHLAKGGRDGWGRAFCEGLERATYHLQPGGPHDVVVHIECDSLFARPVMPIAKGMMLHGVKAMAPPVRGTKSPEPTFIETGLMFFRTDYLRASGFVEKYNWQDHKPKLYPKAPEYWVRKILGDDLDVAMPWLAARGDKGTITSEKVHLYDWITHVPLTVWDAFAERLDPTTDAPALHSAEKINGLMLNLGCGTNRLPEPWQNFDAELDISKPLPFPDGSARFIVAEHVMEHLPYLQAYAFMRECRRVLEPGGVLRIAVPSIARVIKAADDAYVAFTKKWAPEPGLRGAVRSLIESHGHQCAWGSRTLQATLFAAGFDQFKHPRPGVSVHPELRGVEGHHRVIGQHANDVETIVCEAS